MNKSVHESWFYENQFKDLFYASMDGIAVHKIVFDSNQNPINYKILNVNPAFEKILGIKKEQVIQNLATVAYGLKEPPYLKEYSKTALTGESRTIENYFEPLKKFFKINVYSPQKGFFVTVFSDVTNDKIIQKKLQETITNELQRTKELQFLLKGAKVLLGNTDFNVTSKTIFNYACQVTGAVSGYVALLKDDESLNQDGLENQVMFLEESGTKYTNFESLPALTRGLRHIACIDGKANFYNNLVNSKLVEKMPSIHRYIKNVLFAPLNIDGKTIGIMGLANKLTDFTEGDAQVCEAFGDLAALALQKWKNIQALIANEKQFRETIEQAYDGILITDEKFKIIQWNQAQTGIYGFTSSEMIGTSLMEFQCNIVEKIKERETQKEKLKSRILNSNNSYSKPEIWDIEIFNRYGKIRSIQVTAFPIYFGKSFLYCLMSRDITEEKKLAKMKDKFVSEVSHELRTPLLSIKSSLNLLEEKGIGKLNEQQTELVSICKRNTDRLTKFITNVLDFQSFKNRIDAKSFLKQDICNVLQEVYDSLKPLTQEKNIKFNIECNPLSLPKIDIDKKQIVRLFINITNNAIKYTNEGFVKIILTTIEEKNRIHVKISDSGIGIKREDMEGLFESFVQIPNERNIKLSSGLGLSISKEIVEYHNGKIWIESDYGKGSTFFVELPIEQNKMVKPQSTN